MSWLRRLFGKRRLDRELAKELRFHFDQQVKDYIKSGDSKQEATRKARLQFGGFEQVGEACRDARGTRWLEDLYADACFAVRTLSRKPGFLAATLGTLALGTGAVTVMFTLVNGVLLRPLAYPEPDRLLSVHGQSAMWNTGVFGEQNLAYPDFLDCQRVSRSLDLAGFLYSGGTLSAPGEPEYVDHREISANLFPVLRVALLHGRAFSQEEDRPGGVPVAILGHSLWQQRFGSEQDAIGKRLVLDGKPYTVIGIAPNNFRLGGSEPDVYTPIAQDSAGYLHNRRAHPVGAIGRLRAGATSAQAQAELASLARHLAEQYPASNEGRTFLVQRLRPDVGNVQSTLWLLSGAVCLVLLIACVNVTSLLLARAVSREREIAVRIALGAGRGRVVRQCLTESAALGLGGGLLGILLALFGVHPFVTFWPGVLPRAEEVRLDWQVLLFALFLSLLCGFTFGLAPAMYAPSTRLEQTLRAGARTVVARSRRLHSSFVICQIALALVLLVSAAILGRTLLHLSSLSPGFDAKNILVSRVALSPGALTDPGRIRAAYRDILDGARHLPGAESAAMVDTVPMLQGNNPLGYWTSADVPPENKEPFMLAMTVTPDYLNVMKIPLLRGRFFDDGDRLGDELVVVIDDVLARNAFGIQEPVGKRLWVPDMGRNPVRVVGVVGHVRYWGLAADDQASLRAQLYYPLAQVPDALMRRWSDFMSITVRTGVPPLTLVAPLRRVMSAATGDGVLYETRTMEQLASDSIARQRFLLLLFSIFAAIALLLACLGIYGVLAYLTGQRMPEMGLRMALGATVREIVWLVLKQGLSMILLGLGIGLPGALLAGWLLERLVEGMQPTEPVTFAVTISLLMAAALLASFLPAWRAGKVDPMGALREE